MVIRRKIIKNTKTLLTKSDKEEDVTFYRGINKKIKKIEDENFEQDTAVNFKIYCYPAEVKDGKDGKIRTIKNQSQRTFILFYFYHG